MIYNMAKEFSATPAGRDSKDGDYNGELFRLSVLVPAMNSNEQFVLDIRDVKGFGSSFLEEAFGGLVRDHGFVATEIKSKIKILYKRKYREEEIHSYIDDAQAELDKNA
jgi:STAS-like domain of unknown function (DUF4325)